MLRKGLNRDRRLSQFLILNKSGALNARMLIENSLHWDTVEDSPSGAHYMRLTSAKIQAPLLVQIPHVPHAMPETRSIPDLGLRSRGWLLEIFSLRFGHAPALPQLLQRGEMGLNARKLPIPLLHIRRSTPAHFARQSANLCRKGARLSGLPDFCP
jgi:hypothetical protein